MSKMRQSKIEKLFQTCEEKARPVRAYLEITSRCNFKCRHCYISQREKAKELGKDEWFDVFAQLRETGVLALTFAGGEFFLHPDWPELVRNARENRFALRFLTNGAHVDREAAKIIADAKPLRVEVSLYGPDETTYEKLTGDGNNFKRAIQGITLLLVYGIKLVIKYPLLHSTWQGYEKALGLANNFRVPLWYDYHLVPSAVEPEMANPESLSFEELAEFFESQGTTDDEENDDTQFDADAPVCDIAKRGIVISSRGEVFPCPRLRVSAGSVRKKPIAEIWKMSPILTDLRKLNKSDRTECIKCLYRTICRSCPAHAFSEHGSLIKPATGDCLGTLAEKRRHLTVQPGAKHETLPKG